MSNMLRSRKRLMVDSARRQATKCCGGKTMVKMTEKVYNEQTQEMEYVPILMCPTCGKKLRVIIKEKK